MFEFADGFGAGVKAGSQDCDGIGGLGLGLGLRAHLYIGRKDNAPRVRSAMVLLKCYGKAVLCGVLVEMTLLHGRTKNG